MSKLILVPFLCSLVVWSLTAAPAQDAPKEGWVFGDMEGDLSGWETWPASDKPKLLSDTEIVKEGRCSGKWDTDNCARLVYTHEVPHDWSEYGYLDFWVHSEKATDAVMVVLLESDVPETPEHDCLRCLIKINWEGWQHFKLYERSFQRAYKPVGFKKIDLVGFDMQMWKHLVKYVPGTVLRFDDLKLMPPEPVAEELTIFQADTDWGCFDPLTLVKEPAKSGLGSAEWVSTTAQTQIRNISIPPNWSAYTYLNMWLNCAKATGDEVVLFLESPDDDNEVQDGYRTTVLLNWQGWKLLTLKLSDFIPVSTPGGWEKVTMMAFYTAAYGAKHPKGTALHFDDMWLSKQPPAIEE